MEKIKFAANNFKWFLIRIRNKFCKQRWKCKGSRYAGKKIMSWQEANDFIAENIKSGKPFMATRLGAVELKTVSDGYAMDIGIGKNISEGNVKVLCFNAGFFPQRQEYAKKFSDLMLESMPKIDMLGVVYNRNEDYFIRNLMPNVKISYIRGLDSYLSKKPWTKQLEGKKVVVVYPFEQSIYSQYNNNREKLFEDKDVLPKFNLRVVKAVQTIAGEVDGRFSDWFEALEYMFNEVMKEDFDVAILGCGAYGLPLAAKIKDAGKQAIHLGGPTQILFGIKGKRWDDRREGKLYNEYWIRPSENEIPQNSKKVEDGCYW